MTEKKFITSDNLGYFSSLVKKGYADADTALSNVLTPKITAAQTKADQGVTDAANAKKAADNAATAAAGALAEAQKKIAKGGLKTINGTSIEGSGNLSLADIGIDGNIAEIVTALPELTAAKSNKLYLLKSSESVEGNTYGEYIKINDGNADKWEKIGEWKAYITVDNKMSDTSTNPVQNKVVLAQLNSLQDALIKIIDTKVDKETGKGLSTNDYTTAEKTKLAGIAEGANKTVVDSALNASSTNPVQNKVINTALAGKASTAVASQSTNGLLSAADKKKLDGIAEGANKITVDSALNATSTNPVQNKVITSTISTTQQELQDVGSTAADALSLAQNINKDYIKSTDFTNISSEEIKSLWDNASAATV